MPDEAQVSPLTQSVPVKSGSVHVLAAVAAEANVPRKLVVPAKDILPLFNIVNLVAPDLDAVKRSPEPLLLTTREAKVELADIDAPGVVAVFPLMSRVARGEVVPIPTVPATPPIERVAEFPVRSSLLVVVEEIDGFVPVRLTFPARVNAPADERVLLLLKNWIFPVAPLFNVSVPAPLALSWTAALVVVAEMIGADPVSWMALSASCKILLPESMRIFPVEEFPMVSVCMLVVPKTPRPESVVALFPEFAEIEAVGVPPATLIKANLELAVAVDPNNRSSPRLVGERAPLFLCQ